MKNIIHRYLRSFGSISWRKTLASIAVLTALAAGDPSLLSGADQQEYQVKAAFINNIARFIQWPAGSLSDPGQPFTLYILGEDRFGSAFDSFEGAMIQNRPLAVRRIKAWEDIPADCRVLYIGVSDKKEVERVLVKVAGKAILTISDEPLFSETGGMVGLVTINNKIRFTVNLASARDSGLMISSNLIKLALSVQGAER